MVVLFKAIYYCYPHSLALHSKSQKFSYLFSYKKTHSSSLEIHHLCKHFDILMEIYKLHPHCPRSIQPINSIKSRHPHPSSRQNFLPAYPKPLSHDFHPQTPLSRPRINPSKALIIPSHPTHPHPKPYIMVSMARGLSSSSPKRPFSPNNGVLRFPLWSLYYTPSNF